MQIYEKHTNNRLNNGCHNISNCLIAREETKKTRKQKYTIHIVAFLFVSFGVFYYFCNHIT